MFVCKYRVDAKRFCNTTLVRFMSTVFEQLTRSKKRRMLIYSKGHTFIDWKKVYLKAGNGGSGMVSFVHSRDRRGGPNGGDGGNGGSIIFVGDHNCFQLAHLKNKYVAQNGGRGAQKNCHGKNGKDTLIYVPVGTAIQSIDDNTYFEILEHGEEKIFLQGGKKGMGNVHFKTSTNVKPKEFTEGEEGKECFVNIELKSIADVGLIGFPNAGKSTLLQKISNAKPKIGNYPFTTLKPNLGVMQFDSGISRNITVADIPGLVQGAHDNKGLGHIFLRHVERCKCLLYVVDISSENPLDQLSVLQSELKIYKNDLTNLPCALVANKIDLLSQREKIEILERLEMPLVLVSGKYNINIDLLKLLIQNLVLSVK